MKTSIGNIFQMVPLWCLGIMMVLSFIACNNPKEHTAPAIYARDSVAMMTSYGVNTLISDSGIMKYRIVAERWEVNENVNPKRWIFRRGLFLEQFDEKFHVEAYIQSDTAYCYTEQNLWHLVGNVRVTVKIFRFRTHAHTIYAKTNFLQHIFIIEMFFFCIEIQILFFAQLIVVISSRTQRALSCRAICSRKILRHRRLQRTLLSLFRLSVE